MQHKQNKHVAYVSLGSNLGDRESYIQTALDRLDSVDGIEVKKASSIYRTIPLQVDNQPDYMNAAACIETIMEPQELLHTFKAIETGIGRQPDSKWAPRIIDLDLVLYDDRIINGDNLKIPHSQMHLRDFVLRGLVELDANIFHPVLNENVSILASRLNGQNFYIDEKRPQLISVAGLIGAGKTTLAKQLAQKLSGLLLCEAYDTNPYLPQVYAGKKELALKSQLYFLESRARQLDADILRPAKIYVSDYVFEKDHIFAQATLTAQQWNDYLKVYSSTASAVCRPVVVIYLKGPARFCLERIHTRNRPYEQSIELESLELLADKYEKLFTQWDRSPVISIDAEEFNSLDDSMMNDLADRVRYYIYSD